MKASRLFATTLRDNPAEAEVVSHQLLMRAGYIRRVASGIYNYLPLMQQVLHRVESIVRDEMDNAGAQELRLPILQPAELWQESGRWDVYGQELMRLKDRHDRPMALGPTHEEIITALVRGEVQSYRQLPVNLYQIQNKYRDERRPRFGLLRGREFIMKDAYSFHSNNACLEQEYEVMAQVYTRIFERCGLKTKMVRSDSGAIGGSVSHEFMLLTGNQPQSQQSGENDVLFCNVCPYAANSERAESRLLPTNTTGPWTEKQALPTPKATTIEALAGFGIEAPVILKSLLYKATVNSGEQKWVMALIRGDLTLEETKLKNALHKVLGSCLELNLLEDGELREVSGASKGFIGPVNFPVAITVVADESVLALKNFALAVNEADIHWVGANWETDLPKPQHVFDLRLVQAGESCPECGAPLEQTRGIEVGNIFQLGTKYSEAMSATYTAEDGTEQPFIMGCYGIGVSRVAAAAVERYNDANGILWPRALAPYEVVIVPANANDETQMGLAVELYQTLKAAGLRALLDDRDERAGVKFKDADLMGWPVKVTVGKKATEGLVEVKRRDLAGFETVATADTLTTVQTLLNTWDALAWEPAGYPPF